MNRLGLLVLLAVALAAPAGANWGRSTGSSNLGGFWRLWSPAPRGDTVIFDFAPALSSTTEHRLPACTAANNCAMQCTASLTGDAWRCVTGAGASFTVTQGTGTAVANVWGQPALQIFSDANAPTISAANAAALESVWTQPHTVITTAFSNTISGNTVQLHFRQQSASGGLAARTESGHRCIWLNTSAAPTSVTVTVSANSSQYGWSIGTCRKSGTGASSSYTARSNGTASTSAWAADPGAASSTIAYFGRNSTAGSYLGGQFESVTIYSAALSDDEIAGIEAAWKGTAPIVSMSGDAIEYLSGSLFGARPMLADADGYYFPMGINVPRVTSAGYYIEEHGNETTRGASWATDALDASSWTTVGTPTVTANQASGPFSRWKSAAEADLAVDDDAAAMEGFQGTTCGTTAQRYTVSCFLAPGTSGVTTDKARLVVETDATGTTNCDKTLTAGFSRYTCSATVSGSPTYVRGRLLIGNATTDTGSVLVSQCQCDEDGWANSPHITNSATSLDNSNASNAEVDLWPTNGGAYQVVFRPDFTWATDLYDNNDTYEPMDLHNNGSTDHRVLGWQYYNTNPAIATRGSGQPTTSTDTYATSNPNVVAGSLYAFKIRWKDVGGGKAHHWIYFDECLGSVDACEATTLIGSDTTGNMYGPTTGDWGGWQIGCRYSHTICMEGHILRATAWRIQ